MNKWKKAGLAVTASAAVISTAHIINQMIFHLLLLKTLPIKKHAVHINGNSVIYRILFQERVLQFCLFTI